MTSPLLIPPLGAQVSQGPLATAAHANQAVAAAKSAGAEWSRATPGERAAVLNQWASIVSQRAEDLARTESQQTGKPIKLSTKFDVPGTVDNTAFFSGAARNLEGRAAGEYSSDTTRRSFVARRSASWGRSLRGTIRCRWRDGRSSPPSPPATRSC